MYHKICCAYDGTPGSGPALETAVRLAQEEGASLNILVVQEPPRQIEDVPGEASINQELERHYALNARAEAQKLLRARGLAAEVAVCEGRPTECIGRVVETGQFDLVVLGHTHHPQWWNRLFGSTVDKVICRANCAVLVVCGNSDQPATSAE